MAVARSDDGSGNATRRRTPRKPPEAAGPAGPMTATSTAAPPPGPKKITFWLHFVGMPVHVGAATSPQAMLAPLRVTVSDRP